MRWSPGWALDAARSDKSGPAETGPDDSITTAMRPGCVVLSAGLDRIVEIDGLFDDDIDVLRSWAAGGPIEPAEIPGHLVDRLVGLGAIVADATQSTDTVSRIVIVHEPIATGLADSIASRLASQDRFDVTDVATSADDSDLVISLRTHDRLPVDRRHRPAVLHVDLRHQRTLVVGPAELPGLSACDACYDTRLARRWPLPNLPDIPSVLGAAELVTELVAFHVERFVATGSHLVNATIAHSLLDGSANVDTLLRVPTCRECEPVGTSTGRVRLPWHAASRSTTGSAS